MSSYTIRNLAPELLARLRAKAHEDGVPLAHAVTQALTAYADGQVGIAARGGHARAARMSPEARSAAGQRAALSRWLREYGAAITPEGWLELAGDDQPTVQFSWHGDALWRRSHGGEWRPEPHERHLSLGGPVGRWLRVVCAQDVAIV